MCCVFITDMFESNCITHCTQCFDLLLTSIWFYQQEIGGCVYLVMEVRFMSPVFMWKCKSPSLLDHHCQSSGSVMTCHPHFYSTAMEVTWPSIFTVSLLHHAELNIAHVSVPYPVQYSFLFHWWLKVRKKRTLTFSVARESLSHCVGLTVVPASQFSIFSVMKEY